MSTPNFIDFIRSINEKTSNESEYIIANAIMKNIYCIQDISLDKLANDICISASTISRYINKIGFSSFKEFKNKMSADINYVSTHRQVSNKYLFQEKDTSYLVDYFYERQIQNINETRKNIDVVKLEQKRDILLNSYSVYVVGDEEALSLFHMIQIDLITHGVAVFFLHIYDVALLNMYEISDKDTFIYLGIEQSWTGTNDKIIIDWIKSYKGTLIAITQYDDYFKNKADIIFNYGIAGTFIDAYASLALISKILTEMLYCKD